MGDISMKTIPLEEAYRRATPGPLHVSPFGTSDFDGLTIESGFGLIATIAATDKESATDPENVANAAVLAHAFNVLPEVVEALRAAQCYMMEGNDDPRLERERRDSAKIIMSALAKASTVEIAE